VLFSFGDQIQLRTSLVECRIFGINLLKGIFNKKYAFICNRLKNSVFECCIMDVLLNKSILINNLRVLDALLILVW